MSEILDNAESAEVEIRHLARVQGELWSELPNDLYIPPDALEVILEAFEGPLDLLLWLIRRNSLNILDINMAALTRQYIDYVEAMHRKRLELAAEYLVMAAMLAEIKSRLLLPRHTDVEDEETDPRAELIRRLQEYEVFKQAATELDSLPRDERDHFTANASLAENFSPLLILPDVELAELALALKDIVKRAKEFQHHHIKREHLSTRERMSRILDLLSAHQGYLAFTDCFELSEGREGVVVTFLAMLELTKEKLVEIIQVEAYGQIHVKLKDAEA